MTITTRSISSFELNIKILAKVYKYLNSEIVV